MANGKYLRSGRGGDESLQFLLLPSRSFVSSSLTDHFFSSVSDPNSDFSIHATIRTFVVILRERERDAGDRRRATSP